MASVSLKVLTLFFLLGVGAFVRHKRIIKDETFTELINIVLYVALPFLYFYSLASHATPAALKRLWFLPLCAAVIVALGCLAGLAALPFLGRLSNAKKKTFLFMASFTNYGFLAIPICYMLFGEEGLFHIVIFNIGFSLLFWTFGIWLLSKDKENPFKRLANPGTVSLALGLIVGLFSIRIPAFLLDASKILGSAAIPLALLTVGGMLSRSFGKRHMELKTASSLIMCRLIIVPAIIFLIASAIKELPYIIKVILVLQAAMPSPSMTPLVAQKFGGDQDFAATGVLFTTLFSLITVSLFMKLSGV